MEDKPSSPATTTKKRCRPEAVIDAELTVANHMLGPTKRQKVGGGDAQKKQPGEKA